MRYLTYSTLILLSFLLGACGDAVSSKVSASGAPSGGLQEDAIVPGQRPAPAGAVKTHNNVRYAVTLMSAIQFIEQKGEQVAESDRESLSKESVLIVTYNTDQNKEVFDSPEMTMDRDQATQYLVGAISEDISIEQNGKTLVPTGALYEKSLGEMGQLRAFLYFEAIDVSQPARVVYYDRLFGSGFMRFTVNK